MSKFYRFFSSVPRICVSLSFATVCAFLLLHQAVSKVYAQDFRSQIVQSWKDLRARIPAIEFEALVFSRTTGMYQEGKNLTGTPTPGLYADELLKGVIPPVPDWMDIPDSFNCTHEVLIGNLAQNQYQLTLESHNVSLTSNVAQRVGTWQGSGDGNTYNMVEWPLNDLAGQKSAWVYSSDSERLEELTEDYNLPLEFVPFLTDDVLLDNMATAADLKFNQTPDGEISFLVQQPQSDLLCRYFVDPSIEYAITRMETMRDPDDPNPLTVELEYPPQSEGEIPIPNSILFQRKDVFWGSIVILRARIVQEPKEWVLPLPPNTSVIDYRTNPESKYIVQDKLSAIGSSEYISPADAIDELADAIELASERDTRLAKETDTPPDSSAFVSDGQTKNESNSNLAIRLAVIALLGVFGAAILWKAAMKKTL